MSYTLYSLQPASKNGFVLIYNKSWDGKWYVLLQKRSSEKKVAPNGIGSVGGRRERYETDYETVIREAKDEIGYELNPMHLIKFREGKSCGWFYTKEKLIQSKFVDQKTISKFSKVSEIESLTPPGLVDPPFGHFWLDVNNATTYLHDKNKLFNLDKVISHGSKFL